MVKVESCWNFILLIIGQLFCFILLLLSEYFFFMIKFHGYRMKELLDVKMRKFVRYVIYVLLNRECNFNQKSIISCTTRFHGLFL